MFQCNTFENKLIIVGYIQKIKNNNKIMEIDKNFTLKQICDFINNSKL